MKNLQNKLDQLIKKVEQLENNIELKFIVDGLKERYAGFDMNLVENYLKNLYKTDKQKAEELNNPICFESIWLSIK